jgi:hypothetical protein
MKRKDYDDDKLIEGLAAGEQSYAQIAADVGLSASAVSRIARGEMRPELLGRINAAARAHFAGARRLSARGARHAVATLLELTGDTDANIETRRKAAGDILKFAADGDDDAQAPAAGGAKEFPGLTAAEYAEIAAQRDGPEE